MITDNVNNDVCQVDRYLNYGDYSPSMYMYMHLVLTRS